MTDKPEWYANREEKYSRIIHGEMNAAIHARESLQGCTLYTWPLPACDRCFVHMLEYGIYRFVAPTPTPDRVLRWGDAFERVRSYAADAGVQLVEVNIE